MKTSFFKKISKNQILTLIILFLQINLILYQSSIVNCKKGSYIKPKPLEKQQDNYYDNNNDKQNNQISQNIVLSFIKFIYSIVVQYQHVIIILFLIICVYQYFKSFFMGFLGQKKQDLNQNKGNMYNQKNYQDINGNFNKNAKNNNKNSLFYGNVQNDKNGNNILLNNQKKDLQKSSIQSTYNYNNMYTSSTSKATKSNTGSNSYSKNNYTNSYNSNSSNNLYSSSQYNNKGSSSSYQQQQQQQKNLYQSSPSISNKPIGLINLTNTCYISACLQVLFVLIPEALKNGKITNAFFNLKKTHDKKDYQYFKEVVQKQVQIVRGWNQQDAQEFLIGFLQVLNRENSNSLSGGKINLQYNQDLDIYTNWNIFIDNMRKIQNSQIIDLFYGQFLRKFQCPQGHTKHKFQRFLSLSLSFPQSKYNSHQQNVTMLSMIQKQLKPQFIQDLICQKCHKKCEFKKLTQLYHLPKILIIHFARFKKGFFTQQKINNHVQFDQFLQLKQSQTPQKINYLLVGVIHHIGTLNRGHYFAHVKIDQNWFQCDDQRVSLDQLDQSGNQSKYAYILVYKKMN